MEHDIRTSLEAFTKRARASLDAELDALAKELIDAAARAEQCATQAAEAAFAGREAAIHTQADAQLTEQVEQARAEGRAEGQAEAAASTAREAAEAATAHAREREARLAAVERLLASVRRLDAARTLRETLEVLVECASLETPRVAVLLIEENSVRPVSQRGFTDVPASGPIAPGGVVEACVRHGQSAYTGDAAGLRAPGFAALADDRAGFASPLRVGDRTVAVLYADDAGEGERDAPAAWPEALELLARHVSIHLENLTAVGPRHDEAAVSTTGVVQDDESARRYARLLISEIKLYNEPAVRLGREHRDLRRRLGGEIERAQRAYRDRIPATLTARDQYFETELVATLADGDASIL